MIEVIQADYSNLAHQQDIPYLLNAYATDPMGGGTPLPADVLKNLVPALANRPFAFSVLAYSKEGNVLKPVGLVNCFEAFSTFAAKPLINIHDVTVLPTHRGKGISRLMLAKVEAIAKQRGCCKMTLEVLSNNHVAKSAYKNFGFTGYALDPKAGEAVFWQKKLG